MIKILIIINNKFLLIIEEEKKNCQIDKHSSYQTI